MKALPVLLALGSLGLVVGACGVSGAATHAPSQTFAVARSRASSTDAADVLAVAATVERYYAALASGDGAKACSMLVATVAASIAEDYGQAPGRSLLRGVGSCPAAIGRLSKHFHARLAKPIAVTGVRLSPDGAFVVLGSKTSSVSDLNVERVGGGWKLRELIANHDRDDDPLVASVWAEGSADVLAVAETVKRYYAALASGDGAKACSMLTPGTAQSIKKGLLRSGLSFLRGVKSCPAAITRISERFRARLAAPIAVTDVHIEGHSTSALLDSSSLRSGELSLERVAGVWKVAALVARNAPY